MLHDNEKKYFLKINNEKDKKDIELQCHVLNILKEHNIPASYCFPLKLDPNNFILEKQEENGNSMFVILYEFLDV